MFRAGDVVEVKDTRDRDWWWGSAGGRSGWFPAAFVRVCCFNQFASLNYKEMEFLLGFSISLNFRFEYIGPCLINP